MKKLIIVVLVLVAVGVGAGAYYMRRGGPEPKVDTLPVTRGDVLDVVPATGTLEAVETVDVGTQVSGIVQELYADFNSIVRKGQVIARLDPSLIQTTIEQRRASVTRAEAELERLRVNLADSQRKFEQAKAMWARQLIPRDQLDTAEMNVKTLDAQIKASQASLVQARADLNAQNVNLRHTVIQSPIDGIVISRNVDPGQTVAASMSAPTLFIIAADLTKMQVIANIDEADVGRMRPGQPVSFRVDAYPNDIFNGAVEQVRLQPTTVQNVVTYSTVIAVPNPELKLKPGMTANVTVEVARRSNVLRVPAAALRFRPTQDHFAALNLPVPPELQRSQGGFAGGRGREGREGRSGAGDGQQAQAGRGTAQGTAGGAPQASGQQAQNQAQPQRERTPPAGSPASRGGGDGGAGSDAPRAAREGGGGRGGDASGAPSGEGRFGGGRGGFDPNMTPEERRKRMEERMATMTPEERERFEARMKEFAERGGRGGGAGREGGREGRAGGGQDGGAAQGGRRAAEGQAPQSGRTDASRGITQRASGGSSISSGATTIDALFAPIQFAETRRLVWVWADKQLKPVQIRYGISDGTWAELIDGDLKEGTDVVTNITTGVEPRTVPGQGGSQNPLMGPQRGRGGPGGGPGGSPRGGR